MGEVRGWVWQCSGSDILLVIVVEAEKTDLGNPPTDQRETWDISTLCR